MFVAIGIVILIVMVFGGFAITGGALGPVMHAIPHEMLIIGGGAALLGALLEGSLAAVQATEVLLVLGAAGALSIARSPRR